MSTRTTSRFCIVYAYISHMSRKVLMFEHLARIGARAHGANPAVIARAVRHAAPGLVMALDYALESLALALSDYVYGGRPLQIYRLL